MEKKPNKRCGSCRFCKNLFKDRDITFCNNEESRHYGDFVTPRTGCCCDYKPTFFKRTKL